MSNRRVASAGALLRGVVAVGFPLRTSGMRRQPAPCESSCAKSRTNPLFAPLCPVLQSNNREIAQQYLEHPLP
jgi:hypothetical protein